MIKRAGCSRRAGRPGSYRQHYIRDIAGNFSGHRLGARRHVASNESIRGMDLGKDFAGQFLPYDKVDPPLAARLRLASQLLCTGNLWPRLLRSTRSRIHLSPRRARQASILFGVPDSAHVVGGYGTSVQGELLVSAFTAAMPQPQACQMHPARSSSVGTWELC